MTETGTTSVLPKTHPRFIRFKLNIFASKNVLDNKTLPEKSEL